MKRLRFWLIAIFSWFFFLYNIERISAPINLASFVYVYTAVISLVMLALFPYFHLKFRWAFPAALVPYFLVKAQLGLPFVGTHLPITVTEVCAIGLTLLFTEQIVGLLDELRRTVSELSIQNLNKGISGFESGQEMIYREIRRARLHHRPAAILSISASPASIQVSLSRFIQEAQQELIQHYIRARMANLLVNKLKDQDVVTVRDGHFIVLLSEIEGSKVNVVTTRLKTAAKKQLGLDLEIGISTFPDEAITMESLIENAEARMSKVEAETLSVQPVAGIEPSMEEKREAL